MGDGEGVQAGDLGERCLDVATYDSSSLADMKSSYLLVLQHCTFDANLRPKLVQNDRDAVAVLGCQDVVDQGVTCQTPGSQ